MNIRCVVTGQTESGKSVFVRDTAVEPIALSQMAGYEFHRLWGMDGTQKLPCDGKDSVPVQYFPPAQGFRFGFFTIPPNTEKGHGQVDLIAAFGELQQKLPGIAETLEPGNLGMHTTDTVDFDVVVSGECWLELDDGAEVLVKAGDCVVQNGTRHKWTNRSDAPCVIAVALVGAERVKADPA